MGRKKAGNRRTIRWLIVLLPLALVAACALIDGPPGPPGGGSGAIAGASDTQRLGDIEYVEVAPPAGANRQLLIFVHGTPGSLRAFRSYLTDPILRERFHMISVTRVGWTAGAQSKEPSLEAQARALRPILEMDRSGRGAILMGHSYGGPVIARAAMDYTDLVGGLVFVATTADPEMSGPRWYNYISFWWPEFLLGDRLMGANDEIMAVQSQLKEMLPRWENLTMPALIVQGDEDTLVHPENADFLQERLANSRLLPRPGGDHFILWGDMPVIRDAIVETFAVPEDRGGS
ncbi:MAG: alpha/beta fold hydrolase [Gammaproteobacteria bacterium]|nr:alpha/beta fold hydrolase [Gammaproteobacteria bacterium]MCY3689915.1 alpha/beta fold hydrolase [Gammaproteobacteria bacterium]MDE0509469.1 alpha/beta fold hydrolase [Gammaproteobacteria bacterium]